MAFDLATLDAPFAALKAYDWGADAAPFKTIDDAVIAAHGDAALRGELEKRFAALLGAGTSRAAKEYVCRKLMMIGTAASVPALAALLADKDNSHMARFALERISGPEAIEAIRKALGSVPVDLKIGMISSLAARGDAACVPMLAGLLAGGAVFGVLLGAVLSTPLRVGAKAAAQVPVKRLGLELMNHHTIALLAIGILLTVSLLGAVVLAATDSKGKGATP